MPARILVTIVSECIQDCGVDIREFVTTKVEPIDVSEWSCNLCGEILHTTSVTPDVLSVSTDSRLTTSLKSEHNQEVVLARQMSNASQEDGDTSFYHAERAWNRAYRLQIGLQADGHKLNDDGLFSY